MKKHIVQLALIAALLSGCTGKDKTASLQQYSNASLDAGFDTVLYYQEWNTSQDISKKHFDEAVELFSHYNDLFDIYNNYDGMNNLKTVNDNAGKQPVTVDTEIIQLLKEARQFYTYSSGEFDITIGSLLHVWHTYRENGIALNEKGQQGSVPDYSLLQEAASHKGWDKIEINEEDSTVYITDPSVSLDVGGIAKGYATEQIAKKLESEDDCGIVAINAGGNNRTIHSKPDGTPWRVRIQNPDGGDKLLIVSKEGSCSFVTSGDYERYYTADDGKKYHHIIDPSTLYPSTLYRSVSIITKDSSAADCLSTSLFTLSIEEGKKVLEEYKNDTGNDVDAIWIMDSDNAQEASPSKAHMGYHIAYTQGLEDSITWEEA